MPFICPLCREGFRDKETLENHAMAVHGVNAEGLQRLMMLMQGSHWLNNAKNNKDEESGSIYTLYWLCIDLFYSIFANQFAIFSSCIIIAESENPHFFFPDGKMQIIAPR